MSYNTTNHTTKHPQTDITQNTHSHAAVKAMNEQNIDTRMELTRVHYDLGFARATFVVLDHKQKLQPIFWFGRWFTENKYVDVGALGLHMAERQDRSLDHCLWHDPQRSR